MYTYSWFTLLYSRNQYNIVKQLSSNQINKKKKTLHSILSLSMRKTLLNCGIGEDLESPLDCKEIQPVHPQGDQSWIFIGRTEAPILWPPDVKNWLIGKDPDAGKDWRQEEKGTIEDEMVGWYHQLDRHEFEQAPGIGEGQGSLACCSPWGCKDSDTTELNWVTELNWTESPYIKILKLITSAKFLCRY